MWKDLSKKSANLTPEEVWSFFPIRRLMKKVVFPVQILMFRRLRNIITDAYTLSLDYLSTNNNEVQTIYTLLPTITQNLRISLDARQKTNLGKSASYVNKFIDHSYYYLIITKPSLITVATNVSLSHSYSR